MKIILVNYRYFISGGPERYFFNIKEILQQHGHQVIPFSIKSSRNLPNNYEDYFLDIVDDEVYFSQVKRRTPRVILKSFTRMFYSLEARRKMLRLIDAVHPDLIYVMQMHNKISPSIVDAARRRGIPLVHRISDFQYMCPNALFYNDVKGVCEDCLNGNSRACVKYRCVLGSPVFSALKVAAKKLHELLRITRKINAFVVPSSFTFTKLRQYGIPPEKLHHIPTFFNLKDPNPQVTYRPYFLYVGRIEPQKGLLTLLKAFAGTDMRLKIIGFSNDGYQDQLQTFLADKPHHIDFLGRKSFEEIIPYLSSCRATIVPSEWYDNFPNAILESFAYRKPVIATAFGSLPELVENDVTGITFPYADSDALRACCRRLLHDPQLAESMGTEAFRRVKTLYSPATHYAHLMDLFTLLTKEKTNPKAS